VAKLSLREDICTSANKDSCNTTRQGPHSRLQSPGVAEWARVERDASWCSSWDAPWGQPPVSPVPRPGRPLTRKPAQRQHRRRRVRSDGVTNSIHGGDSGGVLPALGKERSFCDRVRGLCSPLTYPVVAVSPPPWVSPETHGGGGFGGGEGARPYKQDTPREFLRQGLTNAQTHPLNKELSTLVFGGAGKRAGDSI
jgi:hypothetical protein